MSEAKTVKDLKQGDLINVNHSGEVFKAKFIRFNSEETSMQVFARGKLTFYPISAFESMLDASKPVDEILRDAKAKEKEKEDKKEKSKEVKQPKKDLPKEAEKKEDMKTAEKKPAAAKEKKLAKAPKVEKAPKVAKPKAEKKEKAPKAESIDRADLIKKLKKAELTPKQIMKETGASKTEMIAAMLLNGIEAEEIKKDLGLTIKQFVYNVRAKLHKSGELDKK